MTGRGVGRLPWGEGLRDLELARAKVEPCPEVPEWVGANVSIPALACDHFVVVQGGATVR
ncbi:MAG: hypothetical protein U0230_08905 [Polyangiales bacterium]